MSVDTKAARHGAMDSQQKGRIPLDEYPIVSKIHPRGEVRRGMRIALNYLHRHIEYLRPDGREVRKWLLKYVGQKEMMTARSIVRHHAPPDAYSYTFGHDAPFRNLVEAVRSGWLSSSPALSMGLLTVSDEHAQRLVELAATDPIAYDAAVEITGELLELGSRVPESLTQLAAAHLRGQIQRPPGQKGRNRSTTRIRKKVVSDAVAAVLLETKLHPTRNMESEPESACDLVAQAMVLLGCLPSYENAQLGIKPPATLDEYSDRLYWSVHEMIYRRTRKPRRLKKTASESKEFLT